MNTKHLDAFINTVVPVVIVHNNVCYRVVPAQVDGGAV